MSLIKSTKDVFDFYRVKRALNNLDGQKENDAEHTWSLHMLFMILQPHLELEFGNLDTVKICQLITIHDIGELYTGDIPTWNKTSKNKNEEVEFITKYLKSIGRSDLIDLMINYETVDFKHLSIEEKIVKSIDRISPSLLRLKSGEGWKNLKPPHNTIKDLRERQLIRHSFSKTMTNLFEDIISEGIKQGLI